MCLTMPMRKEKMKLHKKQFMILAFIILLLAACAGPAPTPAAVEPADTAAALPSLAKNSDGYVDIDIAQLAATMPGEGYTLVNVHIPYEGELPNTDLFIPYNEILDHLDELPDKDQPIVLYCRSGSMSTEAAAVLAGAGYTNVYEVDGGFNAWKAAGYELLMKE